MRLFTLILIFPFNFLGLFSQTNPSSVIVDADLKEWDSVYYLGFDDPWGLKSKDSTRFDYAIVKDTFYFYFKTLDKTLTTLPFEGESSVSRDRVELFFASEPDIPEYYCIEIDPFGYIKDYKTIYYRDFDFSWNNKSLSVATLIDGDYYTVEGKISMKEIRSFGIYNTMYLGAFRADYQGELVNWFTKTIPDSENPDYHIASAFEEIILKEYNSVNSLKDTLEILINENSNELVKLHFQSFLNVMNSQSNYSYSDTNNLANYKTRLVDENNRYRLKDEESYLTRKRLLTISWQSPTDNETSFTTVQLPEDYKPENSYPLYVYLHGRWDVAEEKVWFLTQPYNEEDTSTRQFFADGIAIYPWGRGNLWYEGISETDIWECIDTIEQVFNINQDKKYLVGFSMGAYGAWNIASKTPNKWAGIGLQGGMGHQENSRFLALKKTATYFSVGNSDASKNLMQGAYNELLNVGNENVMFSTFDGGHTLIDEETTALGIWLSNFNLVINNETNTENTNSYKELIVFPNPAKTHIYIQSRANSSVYNIYSLDGKLKKQGITNNNVVDISILPSNIYLLKIVSGNKVYTSKLLVK